MAGSKYKRVNWNHGCTLETLDVDSGKRTVLHEFNNTAESPNWTKDNKYIIFNRDGLIYKYEIFTGSISEIYTGAATENCGDHVLSPDDKYLAITHHTWEDGQNRIYTVPLTGGEPVLITPLAPSMVQAWSPDGRTLTYCGGRDGVRDVYIIPCCGGRETKLTADTGLNCGSEFTPDGKHIWFTSSRTGMMQVWRMDVDGGNQTQMTFDESQHWFPHISPDGQRVVFLTYRKEDIKNPEDHPANMQIQIHLMPVNGGAPKVIAEFLGGTGTIHMNPWAPDSKTIAMFSHHPYK